MKILVTGGSGFIGSALIRHLIAESDHAIVNVDTLTYAATPAALRSVSGDTRYAFVREDIRNGPALKELFDLHQPDGVIHLAAESHVDRSIAAPEAFIDTNINGTFRLLDVAARHYEALPPERKRLFRFHHVSTDEVYGSLGASGTFSERARYAPNSPYAASKAAADHLVRAWNATYGLPTLTSNCSNNYGPYQFTEKLIPSTIMKALAGQPLPLYGDGQNVRDWLYVEDHARALRLIFEQGCIGEQYNVGGNAECANAELVHFICEELDALAPDPRIGPRASLITFVPDRKGHDRRYAIDASKLRTELSWAPRETLRSGMSKTIRWYLTHANRLHFDH